MPLTAVVVTDSVSQVVGGGYIVPSASTPGAFRLVWGTECSCPHTGPRQCRHRRLVAAYVKAQDARRPRPSAPANISLMVD